MAAFQGSIEANFCTSVNNALRARNGQQLLSILQLEPPFGDIYQQLIQSLQSRKQRDSAKTDEQLESIVRNGVPETHEGEDEEGRPVANWTPMVTFLAAWMAFIRDVNVENLLETYERLSDLQQKANSALQHPTKGILILPTVIAYAKVFSRVAIGLDNRPELIQHLISTSTSDEGRRESLPEKAANILRTAFITCLNDRNTAPRGITKSGQPSGKKIGIYKMANISLKILFQCEKLENAQMIFNNIQNSSPPLSIYPASERVTYLYYLGRFQFATTNFHSALLCLQKAYDDCPTAPFALAQRRKILIYLLASNILLGRFPTPSLYSRPEARGLAPIFTPLTTAIRKGDLESFRRITALDLSHPSAPFFLRHRIFYQLGNYCEIYVWRSLFRRVFLLTGSQGQSERAAPTLDLHAVLLAFTRLEQRALMTPAMSQANSRPGDRHISFAFADYTTPPASSGYIDPDFADMPDVKPYFRTRDIEEIEAICGSLVLGGFLSGYISRRSRRFAIQGARRAGSAVKAGFPGVWEVLRKRAEAEGMGEGNGWGEWRRGVVRLAGARPAGS
ncbi:hypothetical protein B0J11DRAFT_444568 [Dendryphion nanum]|uniref:PCI domain-containing protein n=1 Tax=Dendryphion nanum TaxID=256645 RepID=A0A9P9D9K1_9PLEO|nr:hypothetical protein B0J11DRAFT_444568 [Dendryphion nanum]